MEGTPLDVAGDFYNAILQAWLLAEGTGSALTESKAGLTGSVNLAVAEWRTDGPFGVAPVIYINQGLDLATDPSDPSLPSVLDDWSPIECTSDPISPGAFSFLIWVKFHPGFGNSHDNTFFSVALFTKYIADVTGSPLSGPLFGIRNLTTTIAGVDSEESTLTYQLFESPSPTTPLVVGRDIPLTDDQWQQFVVTVDGTNTVAGTKVYFNSAEQFVTGSLEGETDGGGTIVADTALLFPCGMPDQEGPGSWDTMAPLWGEVDHFIVFNRALTPGEIVILYGNPYLPWAAVSGIPVFAREPDLSGNCNPKGAIHGPKAAQGPQYPARLRAGLGRGNYAY